MWLALLVTVIVGTNPSGVSVSLDGTKVYVANTGSNNVAVINTANNTAGFISGFSDPYGISVSPDGTKVYVVNAASASLSVINTATNSIITTVAVGNLPRGVSVSPDGTKVYDLATGMSLLVFYVLAMQCMSTLAVVKRETRSWKWPTIQLVYMTLLAYVMSWLTYHIFI